ncbi:hypothetical protein BpHYR1_017663 [Brachionus plicatilis]|uniref:Uncharacterized protein n=1 Tax=Brachionus plicatilis TaxID=10195 RepID=A0A3M7RAN5_BRAPC|nr:hypothetical protein BpHYR1_017663 [Brachionus plicatilis]
MKYQHRKIVLCEKCLVSHQELFLDFYNDITSIVIKKDEKNKIKGLKIIKFGDSLISEQKFTNLQYHHYELKHIKTTN